MPDSSAAGVCSSRIVFSCLGALVLLAVGCSSSSSSSSSAGDGGVSGAVPGALNTRCMGVAPVVVNMSSCTATPAAEPAGTTADAGGGAPEFGETLYNASGNDDDCKYTLAFTDSPELKVNQAMTFKLTLKKLADGAPATGAASNAGVSIEGFMRDTPTHTLPNTTPPMTATETPPNSGVYTISPVKFDASGRWVIRFHLFEGCTDAVEDSPHGHGAFFFDVP